MSGAREPASFRDPAGFVFRREGRLLRQIDHAGREDYERLLGSGLYEELAGEGWLVAHEPAAGEPCEPERAWALIAPDEIPFVSHPYEWPYSALWAAAKLTLRIQRRALRAGMSLKDATAYNVQFRGARPVWIDTLSFERARENRPWPAYRQFCEHFLAPLALMRHRGLALGSLSRNHLDGVPLPLASRLLPLRTRLRPGLAIHLHLHARSMERHGGRGPEVAAARPGRFDARAMGGLLDSLDAALAALAPRPATSAWSGYYDDTSYTPEAERAKQRIVEEWVGHVDPEQVWDLGCNTGRYGVLAARGGRRVVAMDADPAAVERLFQDVAAGGPAELLPLVVDLANPSPDLGWECRERASLLRRGPADLALALALVHHLAIGRNVPLERIADFLARACRALVIEFVPKDDPQVRRMLAVRDDVFPDYDQPRFEKAFARRFAIEAVRPIPESPRTLYLLSTQGS